MFIHILTCTWATALLTLAISLYSCTIKALHFYTDSLNKEMKSWICHLFIILVWLKQTEQCISWNTTHRLFKITIFMKIGSFSFHSGKKKKSNFFFPQSPYQAISFMLIEMYFCKINIYLHPSQAKIITWNEETTSEIFIFWFMLMSLKPSNMKIKASLLLLEKPINHERLSVQFWQIN